MNHRIRSDDPHFALAKVAYAAFYHGEDVPPLESLSEDTQRRWRHMAKVIKFEVMYPELHPTELPKNYNCHESANPGK